VDGGAVKAAKRYHGLTRFQRTRIPEPPYQCGFEPEQHSYGEYFNHISLCEDADCQRRFVNHMLLQTYFARRAEGATIHGNEAPEPVTSLPHGVDPLSLVEVDAAAQAPATFRKNSTALRSPNGYRRR
jgi:hypothetical protein